MEETMELATLDRLIKEREHTQYLITLLEKNRAEEALEILKRDHAGIEEALKSK